MEELGYQKLFGFFLMLYSLCTRQSLEAALNNGILTLTVSAKPRNGMKVLVCSVQLELFN